MLVQCTPNSVELSVPETLLLETARLLGHTQKYNRDDTQPGTCQGVLQAPTLKIIVDTTRLWSGRIEWGACEDTFKSSSYTDHLLKEKVNSNSGVFIANTPQGQAVVRTGCICREQSDNHPSGLVTSMIDVNSLATRESSTDPPNPRAAATCNGFVMLENPATLPPGALLTVGADADGISNDVLKVNTTQRTRWYSKLAEASSVSPASASIISLEIENKPLPTLIPRRTDATYRQSTQAEITNDISTAEKSKLSAASFPSIRVTFQTEIRSPGNHSYAYPNFCYLTSQPQEQNVNVSSISPTDGINNLSDSVSNDTARTTSFGGNEAPRAYIIQDGCPTSSRWDFRVMRVKTDYKEGEAVASVTMSFSLAGLQKSSLLSLGPQRVPSKLKIHCEIDLYDEGISEAAQFSRLCNEKSQSLPVRELSVERQRRVGPELYREDTQNISGHPNGIIFEDNDETARNLVAVSHPDNHDAAQDVRHLEQLLQQVKSTFSRPLRSVKKMPTQRPTAFAQLDDDFIMPVLPLYRKKHVCDPDFVKRDVVFNKNRMERTEMRQVLKCRPPIKEQSTYVRELSSAEAMENQHLEKTPLGNAKIEKCIDDLLTSSTGRISTLYSSQTSEKRIFGQASNRHIRNTVLADFGRVRRRSRYEERGLHETDHLHLNTESNPHMNRRATLRRRLLIEKEEIKSMPTNSSSSSSLPADRIPFQLRNFFLIPKIPEEAKDTSGNDLFYSPDVESEFQKIEVPNEDDPSLAASQKKYITAPGTALKTVTENTVTAAADTEVMSSSVNEPEHKTPEYLHMVSEVNPEQTLPAGAEPVNRGVFGIGRYVPLAQTSIAQAVNQISYGPWFVKWGRNKPEKSSQTIVASERGFLDGAISGTQKEASVGGGWGNLLGAVSYNEVQQEMAVSAAVGNYGIKVDRSQTYNATAVEIFARGFQSGTLVNFVDRNFGQRFRVRNFEISLQHDFDDYFYPADPGFGTEFLVQYRGANFALANDIAERKIGLSVGLRGYNIAILHDFDQYLTEVQANVGRGWQLALGWDFPDMYSAASFVEAGFGRLNRLFAQAGAGIGDDGVPQASARLQGRNIGVDVDFLNELGQRIFQYAVTVGRFSYVWQASIDLTTIRVPQLFGVKPADVEKLLLSFLPNRP